MYVYLLCVRMFLRKKGGEKNYVMRCDEKYKRERDNKF